MKHSALSFSVRTAVFLTTFSGLVFEIGLTRIYSATIWYHFAFVAISIALLGWGLGGMIAHLWRRNRPATIQHAAAALLLYGLSLPVCLWVLAHFPFDFSRLPLYFVLPLVPFLLAGIALSIVFDIYRTRAGNLYFVDLLGASLGALGVTFLLQFVGGEATVLVAAATAFFAAACLSFKLRPAAILLGMVVFGTAFVNERAGVFRVIPGTIKAMRKDMDRHPGAAVAQEGWNAYSRISAVEGVTGLARLYIDSDAWTSVYPWDGRVESLQGVRDSFRALPFRFTPNAETLVIGPGGGADVVAALASGSRHVTACEMNPLMLKFVRHYGARAGNIYDRPDVDVVQSEGRNFISRTDKKFDIIFLGFVDSWASVASGGLSLSENYLYTTEAFRAYYDHLTDNGMVVILRWDTDIPRLVSNAVALLGARDAESHVGVMMEDREINPDGSDPPQMLFMLKKTPFTPAQTHEMTTDWKSLARPFILSGVMAQHPYDDLLSGRVTPVAYEKASPTRVGPVFDDAPLLLCNGSAVGNGDFHRQRLLSLVVCSQPAASRAFCFTGKAGRRGRCALRGIHCLFLRVRLWIYCRRTVVIAAFDVARRAPDLHAVRLAVHAAGVRRDRQRNFEAGSGSTGVPGHCGSGHRRGSSPAPTGSGSSAAPTFRQGADGSIVHCADRRIYGDAVSPRAAADRSGAVSRSAVLLGPQRYSLCNRLGDHGVYRSDRRIPGRDAGRLCLLHRCREFCTRRGSVG